MIEPKIKEDYTNDDFTIMENDQVVNMQFDIDDVINLASKEVVNATEMVVAAGRINLLQDAINNYSKNMNNAALTSHGLVVHTPSAQFKGFQFEAHTKCSFRIDMLSKGIPDWKAQVFGAGEIMPDGTRLSGIDMKSDLVLWKRGSKWSKPYRTADYQLKMHNDHTQYAKDFRNPQYKGAKFVGGKGQGVPDRMIEKIASKTITSDPMTPEEAKTLAEAAKAQQAPKYKYEKEKIDALKEINLRKAIKFGSIAGCIGGAISSICDILKNKEKYEQEEFIDKVVDVLWGAGKGGIDGAIRGGMIFESVKVVGKIINKDIAIDSIEAVPIAALANASVDIAKNIYKCFVLEEIDVDDLLCDSVNDVYRSFFGFGGAKIGMVVAEKIATKKATEIGATVGGAAAGPPGAVIGAVVGGLIIGCCANAIIKTADADAKKKYDSTLAITRISEYIEKNEVNNICQFVNTMGSLSEYKFSFKDLLPCYNLISDLKEYNLHMKAIKSIKNSYNEQEKQLDENRIKNLEAMMKNHEKRIEELKIQFENQRQMMSEKNKESIRNYIENSYYQYITTYSTIQASTKTLLQTLQERQSANERIVEQLKNRNAIDKEINEIIEGLNSEQIVKPFLSELRTVMKNDYLLMGKQFISFDEALQLTLQS